MTLTMAFAIGAPWGPRTCPVIWPKPAGAGRPRTAPRAIDRRAVGAEPAAPRTEPRRECRADRPVGARAPVEQQITAVARGPHQIPHDRAHRLVVRVGDVEAPGIVHRE